MSESYRRISLLKITLTLGLILASCRGMPGNQVGTIELTSLRPELREQRVAFVKGDTIFLMRVDGTDLITITPTIGPPVGRPSVSPDGMQIAYSCLSEQFQRLETLKIPEIPLVSVTIQSNDIPAVDMCLATLDGSAHRLVTASQIPWAVGLDAPAFSPDGNKILFTAGFSQTLSIFEINIDGSGLRQLADRGRDASYSPDGRQIVFVYEDAQIWVMNADGSARKKLAGDANIVPLWPQYTPDGRYIIFSGIEVNFIKDLLGQVNGRLYALDINNLTIRCLTPYDEAILVAISADGKEVVYQSYRPIEGIYVVNIDGSEKRKLGKNLWDILQRGSISSEGTDW